MEQVPPRILLVEPDGMLRRDIISYLSEFGLDVLGVADGAEAIALANRTPLSAVVTELIVPGVSGTDLVRGLRASSCNRGVPILVLSHRGDEIDRVVAFELGVDDYVVKPFSVRELLLRVRTLIRRTRGEAPNTPTVRFGGCEMDTLQMRLRAGGREVKLTPTEFWILEAIVRRGGAVVPRGALIDEVWTGAEMKNTRTLDTHVKRLRRRLGPWAGCIETVRSVGYRLVADAHPQITNAALG